MNPLTSSHWKLVREIGLDYAKTINSGTPDLLTGPIHAERTPAGGLLVVDEVLPSGFPPRAPCRTLLLSANRELTYDSSTRGIDDAYGCLAGDDAFAVLDRDARALILMSLSGQVVGTLDLSVFSKHPPTVMCWTPRKTFLIAFLNGPRNLDLLELDRHGRVFWSSVNALATIGVPASLQVLPDDSILVADEFHHVVWQLERDGSSIIRWGEWHSPSGATGNLHRPRSARLLPSGTLLIADAHNGRILAVDRLGHATPLRVKNRALFTPSGLTPLRGNRYLVCDAGSRCVFELDSRGNTLPMQGSLNVRKRHFSFPRSVQYSGGTRYLIANTALNSLVDLERGKARDLPVQSNGGLFWPRAVRRTRKKTLLVADGRNSRILELSADGYEIRQLKQSRYKDLFITLQDPHDIRLQPNGNLLIVDTPQGVVFETDWSGHAFWAVGLDGDITLRDPHSAQQLADGRILIADTYNHRLVFADPRTRAITSVNEISSGGCRLKLSLPRYAEVNADGTLAIVDSGNNRLLVTDLEFSFLDVLTGVLDSPIPHFKFPRWVQPISRGELVISDHGNHRVLHLKRAVAPVAGPP